MLCELIVEKQAAKGTRCTYKLSIHKPETKSSPIPTPADVVALTETWWCMSTFCMGTSK